MPLTVKNVLGSLKRTLSATAAAADGVDRLARSDAAVAAPPAVASSFQQVERDWRTSNTALSRYDCDRDGLAAFAFADAKVRCRDCNRLTIASPSNIAVDGAGRLVNAAGQLSPTAEGRADYFRRFEGALFCRHEFPGGAFGGWALAGTHIQHPGSAARARVPSVALPFDNIRDVPPLE